MRLLAVAAAVLSFAAPPVLLPAPAHAAPGESTELTLSTGRRIDDLNWNIAGTSPFGNYVNVLSELTWSNVESQEVRLAARVNLNRYLVKGEAGYGFITEGENQDSDFRGNDRTLEYSRSNNSADDGSVWDLSGAVGYRYGVKAPGGSLELVPLLGLSYHRQNLTITDGVQTVTFAGGPALGPFPGLDSTYKAGWGGPWVGAEVAYDAGRLKLFGGAEFHLVYYRAEADWNLRTSFQHPLSFEHWGNGNGIVISLGAEYNISQRWAFTVGLRASDFQVSDGTDRTYFASGLVTDTPLNEVNWESKSGHFGLRYRY